MTGQIRIGRVKYVNGEQVKPSYPGFTTILVLTKSSAYGELGPYVLKDDKGRIMENIWQFSKIYPWVPEVEIPYTKKFPKIVWRHQRETHVDNGVIQPAYWAWREKGYRNPDAVRYPVGNGPHKSLCLGCILEPGKPLLSYVEARKQIYLPWYSYLVKQQRQFKELKERLARGENLLIAETDGPHQESMAYYKDKYKVGDNFIERDTMLYTPENFRIMLEDPKYSFGHGYCLAAALAGDA